MNSERLTKNTEKFIEEARPQRDIIFDSREELPVSMKGRQLMDVKEIVYMQYRVGAAESIWRYAIALELSSIRIYFSS